MSAQRIGAGEAPTATPLAALLELSFADELLLARVQALVAFPVMLPSECLSTHRANERTLVSVGSQMRAQVVGPGEALGAQVALEGCRVLLDPFGISTLGARSLVFWICQPEDIFSIWERGCRLATPAR